MANIPKNIINDIRTKANIVDVIRHYIPVSEKGNGYVAVCPFHNDHLFVKQADLFFNLCKTLRKSLFRKLLKRSET